MRTTPLYGLLIVFLALPGSPAAEPGGDRTILTFAPFDDLIKRCAITPKGVDGTYGDYMLSPDYTLCSAYNGISECVTVTDTRTGAVRANVKIPHRLQGAGAVMDGFVGTAAVYHIGKGATPEETFQCAVLLDQGTPLILTDPAVAPKPNVTILYHAVTICIRSGKSEVDSFFAMQEKTFDGMTMRLVFSRFDEKGVLINSVSHRPTKEAIDGILNPLFTMVTRVPPVPIWQDAERGITENARTPAYAIYKAGAPACFDEHKGAGEICEAADHRNELLAVLAKTATQSARRYGAVMIDGSILGTFESDDATAFATVDMLADTRTLDPARTVVTALPAYFHLPQQNHKVYDAGDGIVIAMGTVMSENVTTNIVGYVDLHAPAPAPFVPLFAGSFNFVLNNSNTLRAERLKEGGFNLHLGLGLSGIFLIHCTPTGVAPAGPSGAASP